MIFHYARVSCLPFQVEGSEAVSFYMPHRSMEMNFKKEENQRHKEVMSIKVHGSIFPKVDLKKIIK